MQTIPKKPPRQKRSPAPVRRDMPDPSQQAPPSPSSPISPSHDAPDSQDSILPTDQSQDAIDCDTKTDTNKPPDLPMKSKNALTDNSVCPDTGKQVHQSMYLPMTASKVKPVNRPVSEVKPLDHSANLQQQQQQQPKIEQKVDDYGILFPNLNKKPKLTRSFTSPESEYLLPNPISPTAKFKEKQGMLRRTNTAPEENAYIPMTNPKTKTDNDADKDSKVDQEVKEVGNENDYHDIPENTPDTPGPESPVYSTIEEQSGKATEYSFIKEVTPPALPSKPGVKQQLETSSHGRDNCIFFNKIRSQ